MPITDTALAAKLAPRFLAVLEARKPAILGNIPGPIARYAVKQAWPAIEGEVPKLVDAALAFIHDEFGKLTLDDLEAWLVDHIKQD